MRFVLFLFLFSLIPSPASAGNKVFLLSMPIQKEVELGRFGVGAVIAGDLIWNASHTLAYYWIVGEPYSAMAYSAIQVAESYPLITGSVRAISEAKGIIAQTKSLEEIARDPSVKLIRTLAGGQAVKTGIYSSNISLSSLIFVETDGNKPPADFEGKKWIAIEDLNETKVRMQLDLPGFPNLPTQEISLKDLFSGAELNPEIKDIWQKSFDEWNKSLSLWDRNFSHSSLVKNVKMRGALVRGDQVIDIGETATGKKVQKILDRNSFRWVNNMIQKKIFGEIKPKFNTFNTSIVESKGCSGFFQRLSGRIIVRP